MLLNGRPVETVSEKPKMRPAVRMVLYSLFRAKTLCPKLYPNILENMVKMVDMGREVMVYTCLILL